jgi:Co/Zn/Cd efflux system component
MITCDCCSHCFVYTLQHVCADTLRSIAVLVAAGIAFLFDAVAPDAADATAAMVVSCVIFVSLLPLLQGLYLTATEICISSRRRHQAIIVQQLVV